MKTIFNKMKEKVSNEFWEDSNEFDWKEEWKNMPEFISENKKPIQQIKVSFLSYDDVKEFAKRLGITVTEKTNSTWFPARDWDTGYVYVNEFWGGEDNDNEE